MKNLLFLFFISFLFGCTSNAQNNEKDNFPVQKSEKQWEKELSKEEYYVLREHGTERAFSGKYDKFYKDGTYYCAACQHPLYSSETKFDSGTGWPSFYAALEGGVGTSKDTSAGMMRTEVHCANCGGHLGHIFNDGPEPTGKRHCLNSVALNFEAK